MFRVYPVWLRRAVFLCLLAFLCASGGTGFAALRAESGSAPLLGGWSFQVANGQPVLVMLRGGGSASRFEGGNNAPSVVSGRWSSSEDRMIITWNDGLRYELLEQDSGFRMSLFSSGMSQPDAVVPTERIPGDHLGSWAVGPGGSRNSRSTEEEAMELGFQGNWEITLPGRSASFLIVYPDRQAITDWQPAEALFPDLRGLWSRQGTELHITWENGWYTILREADRGHQLLTFPPSEPLDAVDLTAFPARRVRGTSVPSPLLSFEAFRDQPAARVALRLENRRAAQRFFRGSWLVRRSNVGFERIQVGRFGGLNTTRRNDLRGDWRFGGQDLFLNWEDGVRQVISPIGRGFIAFEYGPGRPIDGVPNRIYSAAPAESHQLSTLSPDQRLFADEILGAARATAMGFPRPVEGFRRLTSRIWPFGDSGSSEFPEDTLVNTPSRRGTDPWWWPLWSEPLEGVPTDETAAANEIVAGQTTPDGDAEAPRLRERSRTWMPVF